MGCRSMFTNDFLFNYIGLTLLFSRIKKKKLYIFQDKYVLLSMVMLCVVCAWHAIIAVCPVSVAQHWDNLALSTLGIIYTLFHVFFFLWMYFVVS